MDPVGTTRARRLSLSRRRADSPKGFGRFRRGGAVATRVSSQPSAAWKPRSRIAGTGSYLPATVVSNADLASFLDTNDAWIRERTGIAERRIAGEDEATSDLAVVAARRALASAGLQASDIDLIVVGTITPDGPMPACAVRVQTKLGLDKVPSFDVSAACAGFLYGMVIADQFIKTGAAKNVLVVGAELLSRVVDWSDRTTAVLFGDGAGAVVLTGAERGGLISARLASEGGLFVNDFKKWQNLELRTLKARRKNPKMRHWFLRPSSDFHQGNPVGVKSHETEVFNTNRFIDFTRKMVFELATQQAICLVDDVMLSCSQTPADMKVCDGLSNKRQLARNRLCPMGW